jgi:hypothetical protein
MSYNDLLCLLEDNGEGIVWKFKCISAHQGPLTPKDKDWNGSSYNVMVEWENGEITTEPLAIIAADDPVSCAVYTRDKNLLDIDQWKCFCGIVPNGNRNSNAWLTRLSFSPSAQHHNSSMGTKFRGISDMLSTLTFQCGNTLWMDATALELAQLHEYDTFQDYGYKGDPPQEDLYTPCL